MIHIQINHLKFISIGEMLFHNHLKLHFEYNDDQFEAL
jgi:hypothetical protein